MKARGLYMKNKKVCIVTTTINPPMFLKEYFENFRTYNVPLKNLTFIVVGDNKTPTQIYTNKKYLKQKFSGCVEYWSPHDQNEWLNTTFPSKTQKIKEYLIPENDMRRRNFGYLRAIQLDSDVTITIDDDNFPLKTESWLQGHLQNLEDPHRTIQSSNNIVNPCKMLKLNYKNVYSRGYPLNEYFNNHERFLREEKTAILSMGLWTNKPDVDSFTNLLYPDLLSEDVFNDIPTYSLAHDNYFIVNTQNTAFNTRKLDIFHNLFMDSSLFHRFDDVWIGLFVQKLLHRMGDSACFGVPFVEHRRNSHDYVKDLHTEFKGICLNNKMWSSIMALNIESKNYKDGFLEIVDILPNIFREPEIKKYFVKMRTSMYLWVELIEKL